MTAEADPRFTLLDGGHDRLLAVETRRDGIETAARLVVDGQPVAEGTNWFEPIRLPYDGSTVVVRSTWLGQVTGCVLVRPDGAEIPFTPPPGSHAARLDQLAQAHPVLYASRHVAIALAQVGFGLLGIGAIVWALFDQLLPRFGLPDVNVPSIDLSPPGWLRTVLGIPDRILSTPVGWIRSGYEWLSARVDLPGWLAVPSWLPDVRIWIPVLIAVFVAIEEVRRRKARETPADRAAGEGKAMPEPTGAPSHDSSPVDDRMPGSSGRVTGEDRTHANTDPPPVPRASAPADRDRG